MWATVSVGQGIVTPTPAFTICHLRPVVYLTLITNEDALFVVVQLQPAVAVTLTLPLPPPAAGLALVGEIPYVYVDWVIVNVCPAIVIVPERDDPVLFAATV